MENITGSNRHLTGISSVAPRKTRFMLQEVLLAAARDQGRVNTSICVSSECLKKLSTAASCVCTLTV